VPPAGYLVFGIRCLLFLALPGNSSCPPGNATNTNRRAAFPASTDGSLAALIGQGSGAGKDGVDHRGGQLAGEGVLLAGVVAAGGGVRPAGGLGAMAEGGPRPGGSAQLLQVAPDAVPGERPQADDDAHAPQQPQLIEPVILAGVALLW